MSDIVLSAGVRRNLLSLQSTAELMSQTQNRLATGKKVNTALDNPTNYFTASALQSRSKDFGALLDAMSNGIKVLEQADNGITAINRTIESMQSTLRQARQDKSFQSTSYVLSTLDPASAGLLTFSGGAFSTATSTGLTTTGSGQYLKSLANYAAPAPAVAATTTGGNDLNPGVDTTGAGLGNRMLRITYGTTSVDVQIRSNAATTNADVVSDIQAGLVGSALDGKINVAVGAGDSFTLTATAQEDAAISVSDGAGTAGLAALLWGAPAVNTAGSNGKWNFSINGTAITLDGVTGANLTTAVTTINNALTAAGQKFQAYDDGAGKLGIRATTTDAGQLAVGGADSDLFGTPNAAHIVGGITSAALTLVQTVDSLVTSINNDASLKNAIRASNDNGKLRIENLSTQTLTIDGANSNGQITGVTGVQTTIGGNEVRKNFVNQYNSFIDQLNKLADDASFNGINLLRGDKLKITFNENGSSTIEIQAKDANGNPSAINTSTLNIMQAQAPEFDSDSNIDLRLDVLAAALGTLRSQASAFGSNLSVVQNRQDFTKAMINTLQTGADALVLADTNEEGANMLALQTRQQLSTTALSLSSQADQAVLRLFG